MKPTKISQIVALTFVLLSCEKIPTPVSSVSTPGATASPTNNTMSVADQEALSQVKARFAMNYRQNGDTWIEEKDNDSTEVRQPTFSIVSYPLSDVDRLNGYEYHGKAVVRFAAYRVESDGVTANGQYVKKHWSEWKPGGQDKLEVRKQGGRWRLWLLDFYDDEKRIREW